MEEFLQVLRRHIFPILLPLCSSALIVVQQVYYSDQKPVILVNVLMLGLNLLEYIPLLIDKTVNHILHLIGIGFIFVMSFFFNIVVCGIPTPLSDFKSFIDSVCGFWMIVFVLQIVFLYLHYIKFKAIHINSAIKPNQDEISSNSIYDDKDVDNPSESNKRIMQNNLNALKNNLPLEAILAKSNLIFLVFIAVAILLPLVQPDAFDKSGWLKSVYAIDRLIYGDSLKTNINSVALLLYLLGLFVIFTAVFIGFTIVKYVLTRYLTHNSEDNFFEEYSTPIVVLVVATAVVLAIRSSSSIPEDENPPWGMAAILISYASNLFAYLLAIIVAIIALLVAFEAIRLVLNQCTTRGTLLKGSMHLIFILIVQYAMGLLMSILQIFALRNVIESLLLFFLPDLDQSVEPGVKFVLDSGLQSEMHHVASDMNIVHTASSHSRQTKCIQKGRKPTRVRIFRKRRSR